VDLPDFVKESVAQIQILCTFQAGFGRVPKSGVSKHFRCLKEVRLFPKI